MNEKEWASLSDLEKRTVIVEAELKHQEGINRGLLVVLEFIRDHLEPRPRDADAGAISRLEDAAYQCYEIADAAIKWTGEIEPPPRKGQPS